MMLYLKKSERQSLWNQQVKKFTTLNVMENLLQRLILKKRLKKNYLTMKKNTQEKS